MQSLQTPLEDLGTLTLNQVTLPDAPEHPSAMFAKPTPLQDKTLELLGIDPTRSCCQQMGRSIPFILLI